MIVDSTLREIMLGMPRPECEYEVGDAAVLRKHVFHVISDENKMIFDIESIIIRSYGLVI